MIFEFLTLDVPLSQGDVIDQCPILVWTEATQAGLAEPGESTVRVVVLTQACDLAQSKTNRVVVAVVHTAQSLVDQGVLKAQTIIDQLRTHRIYGWYFLPAGPIPESIVDLRDLHTIPRLLLENLIAEGNRLCRVATPYREHLAQHFATTYSRIGLPKPYHTDPKI